MIAELTNTAEIEQGKVAQGKAKKGSVKKFAAMMVKHHGEAKQEQSKLFQKLGLTPTQSQQSMELKQTGDNMLSSLKSAEAASFDVAYMDGQVRAHQKVLETIDQQLLPSATTPELIDGLKKMRSTVESHLTEAKSLQTELAKSDSPSPRPETR